ncbi:MAG: nicotinamide riboside transporter PnuC [bacterium]|nr:nicotinamide riboside transporter PnuC [bacterium]
MTWIEGVAVVFGLLCVWLTIRQNIWCWPTGLVQVVLFIIIFYQVKLYSDLILHVIYVFMQIYGWRHWLHGGQKGDELPVTSLSGRSQWTWTGVTVVGTIVWGLGMATFTDAAIPFGDAFTTVASLVAQWLMARKRLESWYFWIAVDVIAIGIYWYKSLYLTSGLYAVFLVLACWGLFAWRRSLLQPKAEVA